MKAGMYIVYAEERGHFRVGWMLSWLRKSPVKLLRNRKVNGTIGQSKMNKEPLFGAYELQICIKQIF